MRKWLLFWSVLFLGLVFVAGRPAAASPEPEYTLTLGEQSFDPLFQVPAVAGWGEVAAAGPDLYLVQLIGPTQDAWLAQLEAAGVAIVQYIHPYTYVVWGDAPAVSAAARADFVRWTGGFLPAYRVLPHLRTLSAATVEVDVLLYRGANVDGTVAQLDALADRSRGRAVLNDTWEIAGFDVAGDRLRQMAMVPGVYSIQPILTDGGQRGEMSNQVNVNNYDASNQTFPGYASWLSASGVDGSGVIIANVDGGIYDTHPDLVNRMAPCSGTTCGGGATSTHGTHTAGIMAADGSSGVTDSFGFLRGQGVAPGANLVEQVYSPYFTQPGGMLLLMTDSYNNGASLSGNSWGPSGFPQGYDDDTLQVDIGVRDADPNAPGNQPLTYVLSFMNGSGGVSSQGTPDEAKNIFTIGSTKMQLGGGQQDLNIFDLSSNTAHGPALDGRTIPHMVAPGCQVDSSLTASGYGLLCGTSMASPHVSGGVALFVERYRAAFGVDPSPAMIKAAFLPVAHDLAGYDDADGNPLGHPFDSKQGWGRMDLDAVINPTANVLYWDNPVTFDNTGESWTMSVAAADPTQPVRLMLVWTDAPGHGLGGSTPAWNNDLDLVASADGFTFYGNNFGAAGWSTPGGSPDGINNTEGIFFPAGTTGGIITVAAANINSDGVPNSGDGTDQDFALVCYNCASEPDFILSADPTSAAVCRPAAADYTINVGSVAGFNDLVTLTTSDGTITPDTVTPPGAATLTVDTTGYAAGSYAVTVSGSSTTGSKAIAVDLDVYDGAPAAPTPLDPPQGATDVSVAPTLSWAGSTAAVSYDVGISLSPNFSTFVDFALGVTDTEWTPGVTLDPSTTYYWALRANNPCGTSTASTVFSFTTRALPPVLLVDDDDNSPDVRAAYAAALAANGIDYDVWDTANSDTEPDAGTLAGYTSVVWFTGDEFGGAAGPGSAGESALATYLDGGGCLFISGQDYHYDKGLTAFMQNYLGVSSVTDDVAQTSVTGQVPPFAGTYSLSYPFTNWSDTVNPGAGGQLLFLGNQGNAAVYRVSGSYATTYWGFPFESLPLAQQNDFMGVIFNACEVYVTSGVDLFGQK